jgi:Polysaccharide deacetylase
MNIPLQELMIMIRGFRRGDYPQFVVKNGFSGQAPVFYYHQVDAAIFQTHLTYLEKNGYFTLTADEYSHLLRERKTIDAKAVVLTFDDGLEDLYTVAYPLLKSYGFRAVAFIIPEWIGKKGMITWQQAAEMHTSGVIDIESHSLSHSSIFVSEEIIDFFHGHSNASLPWETPVVRRDGQDRTMTACDLGAPVFRSASRLSDARRYFPAQGLERACIDVVSESGGTEFFSTPDWRSKLCRIVRNHNSQNGRGHYETRDEQKTAIRRDLTLSRRLIEDKLPGKSVKHFAFPWSQIGSLTASLLAECGYESAYAGLPTSDLPYTRPKIYRLHRVSGDFIFRLPGRGRRSLVRICFAKSMLRLVQGRH